MKKSLSAADGGQGFLFIIFEKSIYQTGEAGFLLYCSWLCGLFDGIVEVVALAVKHLSEACPVFLAKVEAFEACIHVLIVWVAHSSVGVAVSVGLISRGMEFEGAVDASSAVAVVEPFGAVGGIHIVAQGEY